MLPVTVVCFSWCRPVFVCARFGSRTIVIFVLYVIPPACTYYARDTHSPCASFAFCCFRVCVCVFCRGEAEGHPGGDAGGCFRDPRPGNGGWRNLSSRTTWCCRRRQQCEQRNRCTETLLSFGRSPFTACRHCFQCRQEASKRLMCGIIVGEGTPSNVAARGS